MWGRPHHHRCRRRCLVGEHSSAKAVVPIVERGECLSCRSPEPAVPARYTGPRVQRGPDGLPGALVHAPEPLPCPLPSEEDSPCSLRLGRGRGRGLQVGAAPPISPGPQPGTLPAASNNAACLCGQPWAPAAGAFLDSGEEGPRGPSAARPQGQQETLRSPRWSSGSCCWAGRELRRAVCGMGETPAAGEAGTWSAHLGSLRSQPRSSPLRGRALGKVPGLPAGQCPFTGVAAQPCSLGAPRRPLPGPPEEAGPTPPRPGGQHAHPSEGSGGGTGGCPYSPLLWA